MESITRFIATKLKLKVNQQKSAVGHGIQLHERRHTKAADSAESGGPVQGAGAGTDKPDQRREHRTKGGGTDALSARLARLFRREHDAFCNPITARLNPDGPLELQLANLIAHDHFRINRIHSIEDGVFALGHADPANQINSGAPQADVSLSEATTFLRDSKQIMLMTIYESRITRNIARNMEELRRLQAERQAQLEKQLEEAQLLHQLAESKSEPFDPRQNGFAFSSVELNFLIERNRQLKEARALASPLRPIKKAA
jgi:hypothetical protein